MKLTSNEVKKAVSTFNDRLNKLYAQVGEWIESANLGLIYEIVATDIQEEHYGAYRTNKLVIMNKSGEIIATLHPVGIGVIGAAGRVDLTGSKQSEVIVYLAEGGPSLLTKISLSEEEIARDKKSLYGYKPEGWYWVDDKIVGTMPALTREVFLKLLERVN